MIENGAVLQLGYTAVTAGLLANVVTSLEMLERPTTRVPALPGNTDITSLAGSDLKAYRTLYRAVGENWLWSSRLVMPDDELGAILNDPRVDILVLRKDGQDIGLLELDFREQGVCEITFFGVIADAIGQGLGRLLMDAAIDRAWSRPIKRLWLHTCTHDHPSALAFYIRSGFRPYAYHVEVLRDPRLTGHLPRDAAPHVPIIGPA